MDRIEVKPALLPTVAQPKQPQKSLKSSRENILSVTRAYGIPEANIKAGMSKKAAKEPTVKVVVSGHLK